MSASNVAAATSAVQNLNISHQSQDLRTKLKGVVDTRYNNQVQHFRGIPYANIPKRFAKPELQPFPGSTTTYAKFGPRCPQTEVNIRRDMCIPASVPDDEAQNEDELKCANLNVTCPAPQTSGAEGKGLPVLMWIYGGSMMNSFGDAQHRIGDAGPLVAQSIELGKPIILVTVHYRLNIFSFGEDPDSTEVNLGLQDLQTAVKWIRANIGKFGGDAGDLTVGGESAGSIYTHLLLAGGVKLERAIMASGSLYTSPPQPDKSGYGLTGLISGNLQLMEFDKGNDSGNFGPGATLQGASVEDLVQSLRDLGLFRMWPWDEPYLKDWQDDRRVFGGLKGLMIGDCKDEGWLYEKMFARQKARKIVGCFETKVTGAEHGPKIAKAYGIDGVEEDHEAARLAALQFLGDARFALPQQEIAKAVNAAGGKAYQYYYDEPNPFYAPERRIVRHGDDLFAIFGGYDEVVNDEVRRVGRMMRTKWIDFVNGEEPWATDEVYVYGPGGMTGAINRDSSAAVQDLNPRRRQAEFAVIREVGLKPVMEIWHNLLSAGGTVEEEE